MEPAPFAACVGLTSEMALAPDRGRLGCVVGDAPTHAVANRSERINVWSFRLDDIDGIDAPLDLEKLHEPPVAVPITEPGYSELRSLASPRRAVQATPTLQPQGPYPIAAAGVAAPPTP